MIEITLNGERRTLPRSLSVRELIEHIGLDTRKVAAEVNRERGPGPGPPTEKVGAAKSRIKGPEEYHEENGEKQLNVHRQRNALIRAIHERIKDRKSVV